MAHIQEGTEPYAPDPTTATPHSIPKFPNAPDTTYGIVCVGFGVTALSLAIALEEQKPGFPVLFLERQQRDMWQSYSPIPASYMQSTVLQDLTTQRNPRSSFTLTNFLHATGRLLTFLNLSKLTPSAAFMKDYLAWSAAHFDNWVRYGRNVVAVEPVKGQSGIVNGWKVVTQDVVTNESFTINARRVILAAGAQPRIPTALASPEILSRVVHSSKCIELISQFSDHPPGGLNVAIVGQNQAAAELFRYLQTLYPQNRVTLFISDTALRPRDTTSYIADLLKPFKTREPHHLPPELRKGHILGRSGSTEAVDLTLIEQLYEEQIGLHKPAKGQMDKLHRILPLHDLVDSTQDPTGQVYLTFRDPRTESPVKHDAPFDLVIAATGYERSEWKKLLKPAQELFQEYRKPQVDAEYRVEFRRRKVAPGSGIWVLGGLEGGSDIESDLFPILAIRSGHVIDSILTAASSDQFEPEAGLQVAQVERL